MATRLGDVTLPLRDIFAANPSWIRDDLGSLTDLKRSMERNGLQVPVLLTREHEAVDGARRIVAAKQLGWKDINVVVTDDWQKVKAHLVHTRSAEVVLPHLKMSPWDHDRLTNGVLRRLYIPHKVALTNHSKVVNANARARGEAPTRLTDNSYIHRTKWGEECAEMLGVNLREFITWRDIFGAYRTLLRDFPENKAAAIDLITKAIDQGYRLYSVLAVIRNWSKGEPAGNRRFGTDSEVRLDGVLPPPSRQIADEQARKIRRMIEMLDTMASEVKAMVYLNPAMEVSVADSLRSDLRPVLQQVGKLRNHLDAHIERSENERER